jgi:hypothetical protein
MASTRPMCPVDHHSPEYAANVWEMHARFRAEAFVGWSDASVRELGLRLVGVTI